MTIATGRAFFAPNGKITNATRRVFFMPSGKITSYTCHLIYVTTTKIVHFPIEKILITIPSRAITNFWLTRMNHKMKHFVFFNVKKKKYFSCLNLTGKL